MKQSVYLLLFLINTHLVAQTNYVANMANAYSPGQYNTLVGPSASSFITGRSNVAVGYGAGLNGTTGSFNVFVGQLAGSSTNSGNYNSFIGSNTGANNTVGSYNTYTGYSVGTNTVSGSYNTFYGAAAGNYNQTGSSNVYVGYQAGINIVNGSSNVAIGIQAGYGLDSGFGEGPRSTGNNNVLIGDSAGYSHNASGNVIVGSKAGYTNQIGTQNTFLGYRAGYTTVASANTFVGYQAGRNVSTGSNNIIIGPNSGTAITNGSENVLMGYNSQAEDGLHNATAIGAGSRVAISDALILGNGANVGIGTSTPTTRLEVVSDQPGASGLRLTQLTTSSPATHSTDQFLTVNQQGEVVKARYQLRIRDVNQWSDNVFSPTYPLRSLASVASYIGQHGHLPGVPSAQEVVKEGVDLLRMNALLLEKVEELTLYSIQQQQEIERLKQRLTKVDALEQLVNQLLKKKQ